MADHDPARVARQPPSSFRGNSGTILELGEAGLGILGERCRFDVEHDLITLGPGAADGCLVSSAGSGSGHVSSSSHVSGPVRVPVPSPGSKPGRERPLGEQTDRVRPELSGLGRFRSVLCFPAVSRFAAASLAQAPVCLRKQRVARCLHSTHQRCPDLRVQPAPHYVHPVFVGKNREASSAVPEPFPLLLVESAQCLPPPDQPLQVGG